MNEDDFDELDYKINEFKEQKTDFIWLDLLNYVLKTIISKTFEFIRYLHVLAISTSNDMQSTKHTMNDIEYTIPESAIFQAIKTNLHKLYETTKLAIRSITNCFNDEFKTFMTSVANIQAYPGQSFQNELMIVHGAYAKIYSRYIFLVTLGYPLANIKNGKYEEYIQKANKLFDPKRESTDAKEIDQFNAFLSIVTEEIGSIIPQQAEFLKVLNNLFNVQGAASLPPKINGSFVIESVPQTISLLGEKIAKMEVNANASKCFLDLLSQLRTFLWKMFDIYLVVSDVQLKCASLDPFNGIQSDKITTLSTGFESNLVGIQNSIFKTYEHTIKHHKEPSPSKREQVLKVLAKAAKNAADITNVASKLRDESKVIRDSLVVKKLGNSSFEFGLTAKLEKFNYRMVELDKRMKQTPLEIPTILHSAITQLTTVIRNHKNQDRITTIREKLLFIIDQNNHINQFIANIHSIYFNSTFELKQIIKDVNGTKFIIPPLYVVEAMNADRINLIKRFKEIGDSFKVTVVEEKNTNTVHSKAFWDNEMWQTLNENEELSKNVIKAVNNFNKINREMMDIFVKMPTSNYELYLMIGHKTILDLNFAPEPSALHYFATNLDLECDIFPNSRNSLEIVRGAVEDIGIYTEKIKKIEQKLMTDVLAAIENVEKQQKVKN